jgi:hypothetical protein
MKGHREKMARYAPRREGWDTPCPQPSEGANPVHTWTSKLQNYETINACCLKCPVCGALLLKHYKTHIYSDIPRTFLGVVITVASVNSSLKE